MTSLRVRLIGLFVLLSLAVAGVMFAAVQRFSSDQIMHLAMQSGLSAVEAQAMFDRYVGQVLVVGAAVGLVLGTFAAWWLLRRILRPLERLIEATRAIAAGDLATRVPSAPDSELQRLADAFNQMADTLQRVEQLRRSLVEDVAHELRTPLTSLQGYTEAMADGVQAPTPEMLRTLHEEIVRLSGLVEGLDQLARGAAELPVIGGEGHTQVDLRAVVARAVEISAPDFAARRIAVRVDGGKGLPTVNAPQDGVGQVFANLLQNAARYTDAGGEVMIELSAHGGGVRCAVRNSGPTIPADELPYIWERLYRVDHSRARASGGAGIGLAIVRQIIESLGGRVGATSADDRTEIWFELPVAGN